MKFLTDEDIEKEDFCEGSKDRAKILKHCVNHDYDSSKVIAFTVGAKRKYSVMYNKPKDLWSCTCKWSSLKKTHCAHILAVHLWLNTNKIKP